MTSLAQINQKLTGSTVQTTPSLPSSLLLWTALIIAIYLGIFHELGKPALRQWDESRQAVNAVEMMERNSWIVSYFEGQPDHWSTKPTLVTSLQVISLRLFGIHEWAVRFPVAVFAALTVVLIAWGGQWLFNDPRIPLASAFILVASRGFITHHVSLTGDFDGVLIFFSTLLCLAFYSAVEATGARRRVTAWLLFGIALLLGTLTKGIAIWLLAPGLLLYVIWRRRLITVVRDPLFWLSGLTAVALAGTYYLYRESVDPGYLAAVAENELGGRYGKVLESNTGPPQYYLRDLLRYKFLPWLVFIPPALFFSREKNQLFRPVVYLLVCALCYLAIISFSATKLSHYDAPVYPLLSLVSGAGLVLSVRKIWDRLQSSLRGMRFGPAFWVVFFLFWVGFFPRVLSHKTKEMAPTEDARIGAYIDTLPEFDRITMVHYGYNAHNVFCEYKENARGRRVTKDWIPNTQPGDTLALCQSDHWKKLNETFEYSILHKENGPCGVVRLDRKK